jgi:transcriptional regulator with XRE-family HTH domain
MFSFSKEMGKKLSEIRETANLTQKEVAQRIGIKSKFGRSFIARLENGLIENPSIRTLFNYLLVCGASWINFAKEVEVIYARTNRQEIMSQVKLPDKSELQKKVSRDIALYDTKIKGVIKTLPTLDIDKVKERIKNKVLFLLAGHQPDKKLISHYLDFANHALERELNPNPLPPINYKLWVRSGIMPTLLPEISRIVHKLVWYEKKRMLKQKPLSEEKRKRMATRFGNYRSKIEPIETAVHALLCQIVIREVDFPLYKAYTRECYRAINKYFTKDSEKYREKMSEINQAWVKRGLKPEILERINNTVLAEFQIK